MAAQAPTVVATRNTILLFRNRNNTCRSFKSGESRYIPSNIRNSFSNNHSFYNDIHFGALIRPMEFNANCKDGEKAQFAHKPWEWQIWRRTHVGFALERFLLHHFDLSHWQVLTRCSNNQYIYSSDHTHHQRQSNHST